MENMEGIRLAAMGLAETFGPLHEMIEGEVAYFIRQGFTIEQAHALATAEFVGFIGAAIRRSATMPGDDE